MDYNVGKFEPIYGSETDSHFLQRGGIYFLEDRFASGIFTNITNQTQKKLKGGDWGNNTHHPYVILSDYYNTNQQFVFCVSVDSKPYVSNMVPFIYNDNIAYINPLAICQYPRNKIRYYNFRAVISNTEVMEIVSNLLGIGLGISLSKSRDEVLHQYSQYISMFEKRSQNFTHYLSKGPSSIKFKSDIISSNGKLIEMTFGLQKNLEDTDESDEQDETLKEDCSNIINNSANDSSISSNCKKSRKKKYTEEDWETVVKMYVRNEISRKEAPELLGISKYTFDARLRLTNILDFLTDEDLKVSRENAVKISNLSEKDRIYYFAYSKMKYQNRKVEYDDAFEEVCESDYKDITKDTIQDDLIVDTEDEEIKSCIHQIDSSKCGTFSINSGYASMSDYEMKVFLAYVKKRGSKKAARKFSSKTRFIESTVEAINNTRNVIYA